MQIPKTNELMQNPIVLLIICAIGYFFIWPKIKEYQAKQKAVAAVAEHNSNEVSATVMKKGKKAKVTINLQSIADGIFLHFMMRMEVNGGMRTKKLRPIISKECPSSMCPSLL